MVRERQESLSLRLSFWVFIFCVSFGFISASFISYSEKISLKENHIKLLRDLGSYYYLETNDYIKDKVNIASTASSIIHSDLSLSSVKDFGERSQIQQGLEGEYRADDGISGAFLKKGTPLTEVQKNIFHKTEETWSRISPFTSGQFLSFWLITTEGFLRISPKEWAMEIEPDHNFSDKIYYESATPENNPLGRPVWTPVYYDSLLKSWMTSLLIPLYRNDRFEGVTGFDLPLNTLEQKLSMIDNVSSNLKIMIFDKNNNIIFHPLLFDQINMRKAAMQTLIDSSGIADEELNRFITDFNRKSTIFNELVEYREKGREIHGVVFPLDILDWRFVVYAEKMIINKEIELLQKKIVFSSLAFALILAFFIKRMTNKLVIDRIKKLAEVSKDFIHYQPTSVSILRNDEIGVLTESFLHMSATINRQMNELKSVNKRISSILNSSTLIFIIATDTKGIITHFNKGAEQLLGYTSDEVTGIHTPELFHLPDEIRNRSSQLSKIYNEPVKGFEVFTRISMSEGYEEREWTYVRKDGSLINVYLGVTPIYEESTEISGFLGMGMNITLRKKQELELHRLRNFLVNIINSIPTPIFVVDCDKIVQQCNLAALKSTVFSSDEIFGKELKTVQEDIFDEYPLIEKSIKERKSQQHLKRKREKDNKSIYENILIYPLMGKTIEGAVIHIEDITDIVHLEEMMIQNEKMLSVGGLAAGMAHEINNPLAGIMQTISVMSNRLDKNSNLKANAHIAEELDISMDKISLFMEKREIPRMISSITESGKRIAEIVENMLSFARLSTGFKSLHSAEEMIEKSINLASSDYNLKKNYDFKKIQIVRNYQPNIPLIPCDMAKIQQVLLNILQNGAQAMYQSHKEKSRFDISTYFKENENMVYIDILDNGPGMTEEIRKRIFEPFFTTKADGIGTGLGLSVSYFIITENHRGQLIVESDPGKGTRFIIALPGNRTMDNLS
jgi:PAS domain S-box-containing protein